MARQRASNHIVMVLMICVLSMYPSAATNVHHSMTAAAATGGKTELLSIHAQLLDLCATAKPTLILISGVGGTQLSGVSAGTKDCPPLTNTTVVWYADNWFWGRALHCWSHHMSLKYDSVTGRWHNSTGTQLWPDYGEVFGAFPEKSKQKLFYALLLRHLFKKHGYVPGVNFFNIPFDWRTGVQGLEQNGGLQKIADDISKSVRTNCGKKAIVLSHSYGANVMAALFQKPEFTEWRQKTVSGWVPVGGPFGGSAATPWLTMLAGDFLKLFPLMSNLLKPEVSGKWHPTAVGKSIYNFAFGLPSWGWMLPREGVLGVNHTVIVTPGKNYTVLQQKQLLEDMGDTGGASLLDDSWQRSEKILEHGPIEGLDTYCLYSTGVITPETLVFNETIRPRQAVARPVEIIWTTGDGVVDLNSLRLCKRFTPAERVVEVSGPLVDHASILAHPAGLHALDSILYKLGVPQQSSLTQLMKNVVVP